MDFLSKQFIHRVGGRITLDLDRSENSAGVPNKVLVIGIKNVEFNASAKYEVTPSSNYERHDSAGVREHINTSAGGIADGQEQARKATDILPCADCSRQEDALQLSELYAIFIEHTLGSLGDFAKEVSVAFSVGKHHQRLLTVAGFVGNGSDGEHERRVCV